MLPERNCCLDLDSHRYYWDPDGDRIPMRVSVTGVTNYGKDPDRFKGYESSAHRGTHVHRAMEALACDAIERQHPSATDHPPESWELFLEEHGMTSPEGIDCSEWIHQLRHGRISDKLTMDDFWAEAEILACEFTMVSRKRSLGGQLDLLAKFRGKTWLIDLKTKSASYRGANAEARQGYAAQAGGYLWLMDLGDGAKNNRPPYVDQCRTLIVTPKQVDWLTAMDPKDCAMQWEEAWGVYSAGALASF